MMTTDTEKYKVTRNSCRVCAPLGAAVAFKGIRRAMSILHGSQGCATYIRRYLISHFREPVDIASSSFSEETAIFGGKSNLIKSIGNVISQYNPDLIGIATTCLSETIGDDVNMILKDYSVQRKDEGLPRFVTVSTPSYKGSESMGFHEAVAAIIGSFAAGGPGLNHVNILPGMVSPEDIRHLKEILFDMEIPYSMIPDYSDTLDGPIWDEYRKIPPGGTTLKELEDTGRALATFEMGGILDVNESAGRILMEKFGVRLFGINLPMGIRGTDAFFGALRRATGRKIPEKYIKERGRLLDAYADGHKYVFGLRALVFGEENLCAGVVSFLNETGIKTVLCATGSPSGRLKNRVEEVEGQGDGVTVMEDADFHQIEEAAMKHRPDIIIGNSKGNKLACKLNIPHIRIGFPIHDRFGAQRVLHLGYRGAMLLFDRIVNSIIENRQKESPVYYMYM